MKDKTYLLDVKTLRRVLIGVDDLMHFAVAVVLLACAGFVLVRTVGNLFHADLAGVLHVLNDVLLVLIVMELLWPVVRFLKREPFRLHPFLYVGIMSSTRRILLIEAEHSMASRLGEATAEWSTLWPVLAELGANVLVILALAIALRLLPEHGPRDLADHGTTPREKP